MARPNKGWAHLDRVAGDDEAKRRVRLILSTMPAERTVDEACRELGISRTRFVDLRRRALAGAVEVMAPRPAGRPRLGIEGEGRDAEDLRQRVADLERDLQIARVQLELSALPPRPEARRPSKRAGGRHRQSAPHRLP